jgi:hypothetical protein
MFTSLAMTLHLIGNATSIGTFVSARAMGHNPAAINAFTRVFTLAHPRVIISMFSVLSKFVTQQSNRSIAAVKTVSQLLPHVVLLKQFLKAATWASVWYINWQ